MRYIHPSLLSAAVPQATDEVVTSGGKIYLAVGLTPGAFQEISVGPAYKVWVGLVSQSGVAAPTASVYGNTLGGSIVWTRTSAGVYAGNLAGAFPAGKIFPVQGFVDLLTLSVYTLARAGDDFVSLTVTDGDGLLANTPVEIRVYN